MVVFYIHNNIIFYGEHRGKLFFSASYALKRKHIDAAVINCIVLLNNTISFIEPCYETVR